MQVIFIYFFNLLLSCDVELNPDPVGSIYPCAFNLLLSGAVELNPDPVGSIYPCAFCELPVDYGM